MRAEVVRVGKLTLPQTVELGSTTVQPADARCATGRAVGCIDNLYNGRRAHRTSLTVNIGIKSVEKAALHASLAPRGPTAYLPERKDSRWNTRSGVFLTIGMIALQNDGT